MQTHTVEYNQCANKYAEHRHIHVGVFRELYAQAGLDPGSRALEVGCGTGNYLTALVGVSGCTAYGLDPSAGMLARVRSEVVHRVVGRAEALGFA